MDETAKCPSCGAEDETPGKACSKCYAYIPGMAGAHQREPNYLSSIDDSLKTIKKITLWFLILSIIGVLAEMVRFVRTY